MTYALSRKCVDMALIIDQKWLCCHCKSMRALKKEQIKNHKCTLLTECLHSRSHVHIPYNIKKEYNHLQYKYFKTKHTKYNTLQYVHEVEQEATL